MTTMVNVRKRRHQFRFRSSMSYISWDVCIHCRYNNRLIIVCIIWFCMLILHKSTTSTLPHFIPRLWQPIRNWKSYSELGKSQPSLFTSVINLTVDAEKFVVDFFKHKILNNLIPKNLLGRAN